MNKGQNRWRIGLPLILVFAGGALVLSFGAPQGCGPSDKQVSTSSSRTALTTVQALGSCMIQSESEYRSVSLDPVNDADDIASCQTFSDLRDQLIATDDPYGRENLMYQLDSIGAQILANAGNDEHIVSLMAKKAELACAATQLIAGNPTILPQYKSMAEMFTANRFCRRNSDGTFFHALAFTCLSCPLTSN